ncbi:hypothetical protein BGZ83_008845 [Gryganskiella cystojenkinii]|nr:hypothetical protein BGZ83_008845 [Gryganskiella cystojenkinii]
MTPISRQPKPFPDSDSEPEFYDAVDTATTEWESYNNLQVFFPRPALLKNSKRCMADATFSRLPAWEPNLVHVVVIDTCCPTVTKVIAALSQVGPVRRCDMITDPRAVRKVFEARFVHTADTIKALRTGIMYDGENVPVLFPRPSSAVAYPISTMVVTPSEALAFKSKVHRRGEDKGKFGVVRWAGHYLHKLFRQDIL